MIAMAITNTVERRKVAVRDINWIGYRNIAWAGIAILAVTLVIVIVQSNWLGVGFIGGFLLASIAFECVAEEVGVGTRPWGVAIVRGSSWASSSRTGVARPCGR